MFHFILLYNNKYNSCNKDGNRLILINTEPGAGFYILRRDEKSSGVIYFRRLRYEHQFIEGLYRRGNTPLYILYKVSELLETLLFEMIINLLG